uniref:Uncharacterized protein n=1 Tax=Plectus sambesii TaxID=2011161 RepID=A0A914XKJ0_9BILA
MRTRVRLHRGNVLHGALDDTSIQLSAGIDDGGRSGVPDRRSSGARTHGAQTTNLSQATDHTAAWSIAHQKCLSNASSRRSAPQRRTCSPADLRLPSAVRLDSLVEQDEACGDVRLSAEDDDRRRLGQTDTAAHIRWAYGTMRRGPGDFLLAASACDQTDARLRPCLLTRQGAGTRLPTPRAHWPTSSIDARWRR